MVKKIVRLSDIPNAHARVAVDMWDVTTETGKHCYTNIELRSFDQKILSVFVDDFYGTPYPTVKVLMAVEDMKHRNTIRNHINAFTIEWLGSYIYPTVKAIRGKVVNLEEVATTDGFERFDRMWKYINSKLLEVTGNPAIRSGNDPML